MLTPTKSANPILQRIVHFSLLLYPVVAHIGILMDQITLSVCYLIITLYLNSIKKISANRILAIVITLSATMLLYAITNFDLSSFIIFLPPILIPTWLAYVFLGSLRSNEAVISIIARRIEGQALDPIHLLYTRRLTALWGVIFLLMICEAAILAIWTSFENWSWWVHVGNYIIVATLFIIEISVRHHFLGKQANIFQMIKALSHKNWHKQ